MKADFSIDAAEAGHLYSIVYLFSSSTKGIGQEPRLLEHENF